MLQTFSLLVEIVLLVCIVVLVELFHIRIIPLNRFSVHNWLVHVLVFASEPPANFTIEGLEFYQKRQMSFCLIHGVFVETLTLTDHSRIKGLEWPEFEFA